MVYNINMKILFVIPSKNGITGASMAIINIILGIVKNVEVYVVASKPPKEYQVFLDRLKEHGCKLFLENSDKKGISYWKNLAKFSLQIANQNNIPIFHLHLPKLGYFLGKDIKKQKRKFVLTVEGDPLFEVEKLGLKTRFQTKIIWNNCKKYADVMCPCSKWLANKIQDNKKIENLVQIYNAIDISRFSNVKLNRELLNIPENEFVVTTTARLTNVKAIDVLIKGYSIFIGKNKVKSRLIILGDGKLKQELVNLSKELGVDNFVHFMGFKNNPQDYVGISDVFVMSSNYEPFGMPAIESGALGIPTIVSKAGGLAEIVIDKKTGYQFDIGDHVALSEKIEKLYQNPDLRREFGDNAKKYVSENFTPEKIAKHYLKIYSNLLED